MASRKEKPAAVEATKTRASKKATPSVASFLSKISTPRGQAGAASPAKGLLGGVTREDVQNVDQLKEAVGFDAAGFDAVPVTDAGATPLVSDGGIAIDVELQSGDGGGGRKAARIAARHTVSVRGVFSRDVSGDGGDPCTRNVSAGGVFIETADLLEVGDPVVLDFPLKDGKRLVVNGRVRWVTPFGTMKDPTPGMGIEFVGVDAQKRERIQAILGGAG